MTASRRAPPALSVLIPTVNEAAALPQLLADLAQQQGIRIEVIVADGGSDDDTLRIARRHRLRIARAPRGRGAQLNAAVAMAQAPWLLCLHADSRLTDSRQLADALRCIEAAASGTEVVAGHWALRFTRTQQGHAPLFRHLEAKSASNRRGTVNGDQGLLIHRKVLAMLGGFDASLPFFEDQRLAAKIFAQGQFVLLPGVLETSARRFETEGHRARLLLMALIVGAETAGLDAWLANLPALYREQSQAVRLAAPPFVESLLRHIASLTPVRQRQVWDRAGTLVAANAWQLAQVLDAHAGGRNWLLRFDRLLAPLFAQRFSAQLIAAALPTALRLIARAI